MGYYGLLAEEVLTGPSVPKFFDRCPVAVHLELGASHVWRCGLWRAGGDLWRSVITWK